MNYTRLGVLVGALALSTLVVGSASAAFQGQGEGQGQGQGHGGQGGQNREAVHAAVEANDYTQLPEAAQEKISAEQFAEMVERREAMEAHRAELESVVAKNDFDGFLVLHEAHKTEMESHRAEMEARAEEEGRALPERPEREEPTEEELQERFAELVAYYEEHGELPARQQIGKKVAKRVVKKVRRGGLTEQNVDRIENLIDKIDNLDKLENILERIANKIALIEDKDISEERKEKILGILEVIQELIEEKLSE